MNGRPERIGDIQDEVPELIISDDARDDANDNLSVETNTKSVGIIHFITLSFVNI